MIAEPYQKQVDLLLQLIPHIAKEECFALKGGTAINMFVRDMPRLSVDIDLTYLPFDDREPALANISAALGRIAKSIAKVIPGCGLSSQDRNDEHDSKLYCSAAGVTVKIEVNTTLRGFAFAPRLMDVNPTVESQFKHACSIQVVSEGELFGGKLCAALDRQHPRDLFDVRFLLDSQGITDEIRHGFLASLIGHSRPIHELLLPNFIDQTNVFESQFQGMALTPFTYRNFEDTRRELVETVKGEWRYDDRAFLESFVNGTPDWSLIAIPNLSRLPAVKWKLANLDRLKQSNPTKHAYQLQSIKAYFQAIGMNKSLIDTIRQGIPKPPLQVEKSQQLKPPDVVD